MEVCAVGLAVAYVLLAIYQRRLCWIAAIASAALYIVIFWQVQLYLETALQVFYIAMAIYGWFAWSRTPDPVESIRTWPLRHHLVACLLLFILSLATGSVMSAFTMPLLPSLTRPQPYPHCSPPGWWPTNYWKTALLDRYRHRIGRALSIARSHTHSSLIRGVRDIGRLGLCHMA